MEENYIFSSHMDDYERLWLGHRYGGVSIYSTAADSFKIVPFGDSKPTIIIADIISIDKTKTWIASRGGGLFYYDTDTVIPYNHEETNTPKRVTGFTKDKYGRIWGSTIKGLIRLEGNTWQHLDTLKIFGKAAYSTIISLNNGDILLGSDKSGLYYLNLTSESEYSIEKLSITNEGFTDDFIVRTVYEDEQNVWIGTRALGLIRIPKDTNHTLEISNSRVYKKEMAFATTVFGLYSEIVRTIFG